MQIKIVFTFFLFSFFSFSPFSFGEDSQTKEDQVNDQSRSKVEKKSENKEIDWITVNTGLCYFVKELPQSEGDVFAVIKIDPKLYKFSLHMASEEGKPLSLRRWAEIHGLDAAINASMYLPDKLTSIGYMQSSTHVNNKRMGGRLGAFFIAEPFDSSLPFADIIEKEDPSFEKQLPQYSIQVQNFRLITKRGKILWNSDEREYSIAAVAKDTEGNVLFVLCQKPMTGALFAQSLLDFGLSLSSVIYVEGGEKAAVFLKDGNGVSSQWVGRKSLFNFKGDPLTTIPNIIGIKKRY